MKSLVIQTTRKESFGPDSKKTMIAYNLSMDIPFHVYQCKDFHNE
jgi:hypothetical protein